MIRRDIYSVKVYDSFSGIWCHEFMARSADAARRYRRDLKQLNPFTQVKIVHPADWVVNGYVAYGNEIAA